LKGRERCAKRSDEKHERLLEVLGGACAMAGSNPTRMFTLTGDST
jgi:hypothetical protein